MIAHNDDYDDYDDYFDDELSPASERDSYAFSRRKTDDIPPDEKRKALRLYDPIGNEEFIIKTGMSLIGSKNDSRANDHIYPGVGISNVHALFNIHTSGYPIFIEDLDSTNGTFIRSSHRCNDNYLAIIPKYCYQILDGDFIKLSDTEFRCEVCFLRV